MELPYKNDTIQHLAGIVPIAGQPLEFKTAVHDSLLPIAPDILAVERAVYECAMAGCETIWVVCHMKTEPILRKRIKNFIIDPISLENIDKNFIRQIPIYYVPIHPRDRARRDCLSWSVLYGANIAYFVSKKLSTWILPEKFYCSFPYGITDLETIRKNRKIFSNRKKLKIKYNDLTVKDNLHISFTFDEKDYFACKSILHQKDVNEWQRTKKGASYYDLKTGLSGIDNDSERIVELPWFYDISTWDGYIKYLNSEHAKEIKGLSKNFINFPKKRFDENEQVIGEEIQQSESTFKTENESST